MCAAWARLAGGNRFAVFARRIAHHTRYRTVLLPQLKSAIWWTTMACNFKCKYCWEVQAQELGEFQPVPFRPGKDWLEAWNRLRPQLLDITGGEPFLMPDLLDVLTGLDPAIRLAITTCLLRGSTYSRRRCSALNPGSAPHATGTRSPSSRTDKLGSAHHSLSGPISS